MYFQSFRKQFFSLKYIRVVLSFMFRFWRDRGYFVFSITRASVVRIGNRDRHWKAGSDRFLMKMTRSASVHI